MSHTSLQQEALQAAKYARHNLALIQIEPERINHSKHADAVTYLQMLIRFEKYESKHLQHSQKSRMTSWFKPRLGRA